MRRKPPLNLDIDEKALLAEINGEDFVSLVDKRKLEKLNQKDIIETSKNNIENSIQIDNKDNPPKKKRNERTKIPSIGDDKEFINTYLKTDFEIDYSRRRRMDVDIKIHDKIKKIVSFLNMSLEADESHLFVRDYINKVLLVHLSKWEDIGERIYNIRNNRNND